MQSKKRTFSIANTRKYLQTARQLCNKYNALLIADDVQTFASTGNYSPSQHSMYNGYSVAPDVVIVAKALTSGVTPGSLIIADRDVQSVMTPGSDGSTYGGNPVMCAAAIETLAMIKEENVFQRLDHISKTVRATLQSVSETNPDIKEQRGLGGMLGLEFVSPKKATQYKDILQTIGDVMQRDSKNNKCGDISVSGIVLKLTNGTTMRISPCLMTEEQLTLLCAMLRKGLAKTAALCKK